MPVMLEEGKNCQLCTTSGFFVLFALLDCFWQRFTIRSDDDAFHVTTIKRFGGKWREFWRNVVVWFVEYCMLNGILASPLDCSSNSVNSWWVGTYGTKAGYGTIRYGSPTPHQSTVTALIDRFAANFIFYCRKILLSTPFLNSLWIKFVTLFWSFLWDLWRHGTPKISFSYGTSTVQRTVGRVSRASGKT